MKSIRLHWLLAGSLILNAACAAYWIKTKGGAQAKVELASPNGSSSRAISSKTEASLWSTAAPSNYDSLLAQLRAVGCPSEDIVIILGQLNRSRMDKLFYKDFAARPYWQLKDGTTKIDSRERVMTYLEATRFEARYLLSPELFSVNKEMIEGLRTRYGAIPEEKLRLLALADTERNIKQQEKYLAKKREVSKPGENQYASSEASWETQQQEHLNTIKSILSPEEFKVYELSSSPLAREQRERLNAFRPSEEEYKVVMALEAQLQAARKNPNLTTEERQRLRPDTDAAVAAALGDERGADYLALRKYNGEPIVYLMARLDLPLATITAVDVVREHSLAQAKTIQANSQLTPAERTAQLAALSRETQSQLTHTLGERGVTAYRDISGDWLGNLDKPASGKP